MVDKIYSELVKVGESEFSYNSEGYVIQKCRNFLLLWACSDTPMTIYEYELKGEFSVEELKSFLAHKLFDDKSILDILKGLLKNSRF